MKNSVLLSLVNIVASNTLAIFLAVVIATATIIPTKHTQGFVFSSSVANAQQDESKPKRKTRRTPALRNKVYEKLGKVQEAVDAKNYRSAIVLLDEMRRSKKPTLNSYELANVWNMYAFVYYTQENFPKALSSYRQVIAQPDLPEAFENNTRFTIAQLYFVTEDYKRGVDELLAWFRTAQNPDANAHVLLAQGYYQLKDYRKSLQNVNKAVSMYREKGKLPKENWLTLQQFLYYDQGNIDKSIEVLDELIRHYQKKNYWLQLSAMYAEKKNEIKQLAAMDTVFVQGLLEKEKELLNMAYMYLGNDVPYKGAEIINDGIKAKKITASSKTLELLGNSYRQAQEVKKAIPKLEAAAAKSDKGEIYARLGNVYLDNDEFDKAITAVKKGLKKGGVKRSDTANLVLGMAYFNKKKYTSARTAFNKAKKDKRSKPYAVQWLKYMDSELKRQKSLEQI